MSYNPSFPEKFEFWKRHDLRPEYRPWFYRGLKETDQLSVWKWLEETYILKYRAFYSIWPEWTADGIWSIPFPGSVSVRGAYDASDFQLIVSTATRMKAWHSNWEDNYDPSKPDNFDWHAFDKEGIEVASSLGLSWMQLSTLNTTSFRN